MKFSLRCSGISDFLGFYWASMKSIFTKLPFHLINGKTPSWKFSLALSLIMLLCVIYMFFWSFNIIQQLRIIEMLQIHISSTRYTFAKLEFYKALCTPNIVGLSFVMQKYTGKKAAAASSSSDWSVAVHAWIKIHLMRNLIYRY